ncbi:hypothetical protein [Pseudonocardia acaciae]|uniref:hypothetical protein n=1 Tax=Pseudonocardia acaciae TaxID=551276 RepID=UPI0006845E02|nr:hypothetical protein [Pseudonocardia acaciae]
MVIPNFGPPGGLTDLDEKGLRQWSEFISTAVDAAIKGRTDHTNDAPRAQFYNLTKTDTAEDAITQEVSWTAFPRQAKVNSVSDRQRWAKADSTRDVQDEYCEWSVTRGDDGKITRVTFTCEGPEYWELLAQTRPDTVLELYRRHVDPAVQHGDLFDASGSYILKNKWNNGTTNGAMHLIQASNTLGAEIELAAAASIVRIIGGRPLTGEQELINCGRYGAAQRNSDPHIGGVINGVARLKADIALSDPVGLYFDDLSTAGWETPDGSDPKSYWTYVRGIAGHYVRAVYEVPRGRGFVVGDVTVDGNPIDFGAQIADFIGIKAVAVACRIGRSTAVPMTACVEDVEGPAATVDAGQARSRLG